MDPTRFGAHLVAFGLWISAAQNPRARRFLPRQLALAEGFASSPPADSEKTLHSSSVSQTCVALPRKTLNPTEIPNESSSRNCGFKMPLWIQFEIHMVRFLTPQISLLAFRYHGYTPGRRPSGNSDGFSQLHRCAVVSISKKNPLFLPPMFLGTASILEI